MPLGHVEPLQPPVHVALVPELLSEAQPSEFAGSIHHAGTV